MSENPYRIFFRHALLVLTISITSGIIGYTLTDPPQEPVAKYIESRSFGAVHTVTTSTTEDFVDGIGVSTHTAYESYKNNWSALLPLLRDSGVRVIRNGGHGDSQIFDVLTQYVALNNPTLSGRPPIRLLYETYISPSYSYGENSYFPIMTDGRTCWLKKIKFVMNGGPMANCGGDQHRVAPSGGITLDGIEAPNEMDHCASFNTTCQATPGSWYDKSLTNFPNWPAVIKDFTRDMKTVMASDSATANLPLVAPSFVHLNEFATTDAGGGQTVAQLVQPLVQYVSNGNNHPYCGQYAISHCMISGANDSFTAWDNFYDKPLWSTESGWSDHTNNGVSPDTSHLVQSKYGLRSLLSMFDRGNERYFIYEFFERAQPETANTREAGYGLINSDLTPKASYTSLKNMITILQEYPAVSFTPTNINLDLTGTSTVKLTALQKSNRDYYLVLRNEVSAANPNCTSNCDTNGSVTLTLDGSFASGELYRPSTGTAALTTYENPSVLNLTIPDDVIILKLVPASDSPGTGGDEGNDEGSSDGGTTTTGGTTTGGTSTTGGGSTTGGSTTTTGGTSTGGGTTTGDGGGGAVAIATPTPDPTSTGTSTEKPAKGLRTVSELEPLLGVTENGFNFGSFGTVSRRVLAGIGWGALAGILTVAYLIMQSRRQRFTYM